MSPDELEESKIDFEWAVGRAKLNHRQAEALRRYINGMTYKASGKGLPIVGRSKPDITTERFRQLLARTLRQLSTEGKTFYDSAKFFRNLIQEGVVLTLELKYVDEQGVFQTLRGGLIHG
jgi:DNA-directed RNA polymerase sigma subunit (sigma70/sigma32)